MIRQSLDRTVSMALGLPLLDDSSLISLSQKSTYSTSEDIADLLASATETQVTECVPLTTVTSAASSSSTLSSFSRHSTSTTPISSLHLGKRKTVSSPNLFNVHAPRKLARTGSIGPIVDENSPFYVSPVKSSFGQSVTVPPFDVPCIIAHSDPHQACFDQRKLSYGVQYEIARLVSCGTLKYAKIEIPLLDQLKGSNSVAAPKTAEILKGLTPNEGSAIAFAKELAAKSPWEELDAEEKNLQADPFSGLDFSEDSPDWYGGRVHFRAKLVESKLQYKIILERAELGPSCRFARRFGSMSFLRVKIPSSALNPKSENALVMFFLRPFILNGRVFRTFFAKDDNVFLFRTNEWFSGLQINAPRAKTQGMSLLEFLNWHNPMEWNQQQTLIKWSSRFSLGLSTSVPGIRVAPEDILHEEDIISPTGSDMTDGCGYINKYTLRKMQAAFDWEECPIAIQCRIEGSKGLLMRRGGKDDEEVVPKVRIRPSQVKIKYPPGIPRDPAMLTLDLLVPSRLRTPVRLSHEVLINLAENGVPREVFANLFVHGLTELVESLMTWDEPAALWQAVAQRGAVMWTRRGREAGTESRARGYGERDTDDADLEDEDDLQIAENALKTRSSAWWWDEISGCPSSLEETVMVLLDAGFTPQDCTVLREKLEKVVETSIKTYQRKTKIEPPMSLIAFIVPDPFGVLEPGEVHIKSTRRDLKNPDGPETDIVLGDVLLVRNPCKLPTDVQKFRAVERPELRGMTDVIVCSVKGDRRQADLLAGGDYDGDRAQAIWQPEIVHAFHSADLKYSVQPEEVQTWFESDPEKVKDFLERTSGTSESQRVSELQRVLLGAIRDTAIVGKYSGYHESAMYELGYFDGNTQDLAWVFNTVLDSAKTGKRLKPEKQQEHGRRWSKTRGPNWKDKLKLFDDKKPRNDMDNKKYPTRQPNLGKFVMDVIAKVAHEQGGEISKKVKKTFEGFEKTVDLDLNEPWLTAVERAKRYREEEGNDRLERDLNVIAEHVRHIYARHREQVTKYGLMSPRKEDKAAFTELPIEMRQDKIRALSRDFVSRPSLDEVLIEESEVRRLRASYAYHYHSVELTTRLTRFPFDVAMRELCAIKARATGSSKTVTASFYDRFYIK